MNMSNAHSPALDRRSCISTDPIARVAGRRRVRGFRSIGGGWHATSDTCLREALAHPAETIHTDLRHVSSG